MIIYKITNLINSKIYIGQTIYPINIRWNQHKCSKNCTVLYRAIRKYGAENFKIEEIDGANSLDELNYREWLWIYKLNSMSPSGYNLKEGGNSKKYSEESKIKMSNWQKGKKISEETKIKMSLAKKGYISWNKDKKYKLSEESRLKLNRKFNIKSIEHFKVKIMDLNTGIVYESITDMSFLLKIPRITISRLLGKETKKSSKYKNIKIEYYKENDICPNV